MTETILFCFVFLSQVLLISGFYARRVISRRRYVLQNFPPSTHPKLYPQSVEYYERWLRNFGRLNLAIVIAGLLIIAAMVLGALGVLEGMFASSRNQDWNEAIVAPFFVLQMFAAASIELSSHKHLRAMASAPPPRVRTTELRRRRLLDFVSPGMLVFVVLTNVAFVAFVLYYRRFEFPWFTAAGNIGIVAAMWLLFAAGIGIALRAPKRDPYQAHQDRRSGIKLVVQQALGFCIATPVLITLLLIIKFFDPDHLEPVISSLFCQGCALALLWPLYSYRVDKLDYDVYRRDAHESTADPSARPSSP